MLSFGCKCILCWTYAGYRDEFPSLVDTKSRKTTAWHDARPVLWELRRLSDEYVKYRNVGAFTHNCTDETPYLKMSNEYKDFAAIQALECEEPLLVGCFEKKDGSKDVSKDLSKRKKTRRKSCARGDGLSRKSRICWEFPRLT